MEDDDDTPKRLGDLSNELVPVIPDIGMDDDEVEEMWIEYSIRAPGDFVISGPLPKGGGPGRTFANIKQAEKWVRERYGTRVKYRIPEATKNNGNRWAFLIKGETR